MEDEDITEDMSRVLAFMQSFERDKALQLMAHTMVINLCHRREFVESSVKDVDVLGEQMKNLIKWNFDNLRKMSNNGGEGVYYFCDPAIARKGFS